MTDVVKTAGWMPVRSTQTDTVVGVPTEEVTNRSINYGPIVEPDAAGWLKRFSPTRSRWPEIHEFDRRVRELDERQISVNDEIAALEERHKQSETADREQLAAWLASGNGKRPEPTAPALEQKTRELRENREALSLAVTRVLAEKAAFVEKHRKRLARDAEKTRRQAFERVQRLVGELEQARADLVGCRQAELWTLFFPSELAGADAGYQYVKGGRKQRALPELDVRVAFNQLAELLREDLAWLAEAANPDQTAALEGRDPRLPPDTGWAEDENFQADQARKRAELLAKKRRVGAFWDE